MIGTFAFAAPLWRHQGDDPWYFVSLPTDVADDVAELCAGVRRGFGSLRVEVTVGGTTWRTSVFPDSARNTYVLPVKRAVRDAEHLVDGEPVSLELHLLDL